MSIVTIILDNKKIHLSCPEEGKKNLESLAEKLDYEIEKIKKNNPNVSFELSLIIIALGLIDDQQSKLQKTGGKALEEANEDSQKLLSGVFSELESVEKKLES